MALRLTRSIIAIVAVGLLAGCGLSVPTDPNGTWDRVSNGVLRVGASPNGDLIELSDGEVTGREADLVMSFADSIGAEVVWTPGGEEALVAALEDEQLDLVVGGITEETPWFDQTGVTRGFNQLSGDVGPSIVWLTAMGENRFISELETYLDRTES